MLHLSPGRMPLQRASVCELYAGAICRLKKAWSVLATSCLSCRGPREGWGSIDVKLGLNVLGDDFSEVVDPFLGVRGLPSLQAAERWVDELDASLWAWFHLFERCNATDEVIVIQVPH